MSAPLWQPRTNAAARLLGLGFVTAGAAILYWQIVVTLQRAASGDPEIIYSLKLIALGQMFGVLGLFWLLLGLPGYAKIIGLQKDRRFLWALAAVALVAILVTDHFMTRELSTYGYAL
jgi:hypothetical protein